MRKLVRLAAIALIALLCTLIFAACGCSDSGRGNDANSNGNGNGVDNNSGGGNQAAVKYVDGYCFSDGVAWMRSDTNQWHCVDKTGRINIELQAGEAHISDFSHGVALVKRADETVELIDKTGKVVSSPKTGEYDRIASFLNDLGMILVYKHINTFQVTENQYGIIDKDGKWQTELHGNSILHSIFWARNVITRASFSTASYIGEGFVMVPHNNEYMRKQQLYNIFTKEIIEDVTTQIIPGSAMGGPDLYLGLATAKNFNNGYSIFLRYTEYSYIGGSSRSTIYKGSVCSIDKNGKITEIIKNVYCGESAYSNTGYWASSARLSNYSDGLFYFDEHIRGFYDISGNLIIDLSESEYSIGYYSAFSNGYCVSYLTNPQGTPYYTLIDKTGKRMFEPKYNNFVSISFKSGMIVCRGARRDSDQNHYNTYAVVSASGEEIFSFETRSGNGSVSDYSEDAALVKKDNEAYFIDKTGKRLF